MKSLLIGLSVFMSVSAFAAMEDIKPGKYIFDSRSGSGCGDDWTTLDARYGINVKKKNNKISIKEYGFKNAELDRESVSKIPKYRYTDMEWIIKSNTTISEINDGILVEMNGILKRPLRAEVIDIFSKNSGQSQRIDGMPFDQKLEIRKVDNKRLSVTYLDLRGYEKTNHCIFERISY